MKPLYFDSNHPFSFANRLLWIDSTCRCRVSDDLEVALASICGRQVRDLGYNTVVFAAKGNEEVKSSTLGDLGEHLDQIRSHGIKVALEVLPGTQDPKTQLKSFSELQGSVDFLLCRQHLLANSGYVFSRKDPTQLEKALEELSFCEKHSTIPILYATAQNCQEALLLALSKASSSKSMITFFAERPEGELHPLFTALAKETAMEQSRLIPLLHVFQYRLTEDLWFSDFPLRLTEDVLGRQIGGRFCGAGSCIYELPLPGTFAECPIWAIGQRMQRPTSIYEYVQSWVGRYYPSCLKLFRPLLLQQIHAMVFQLRLLDGQIQNRAFTKAKRTIDRLCYELKVFSEELADCREEWQYRDQDISIESLSSYLYHLQLYVKKITERASQSIGSKIPLLIQEFIPVNFYL